MTSYSLEEGKTKRRNSTWNGAGSMLWERLKISQGGRTPKTHRLKKKLGRWLLNCPAAHSCGRNGRGARCCPTCWLPAAALSGKIFENKVGGCGGWCAGSLRSLSLFWQKAPSLLHPFSFTFSSPPEFSLPAHSLLPLQRSNLKNLGALFNVKFSSTGEIKTTTVTATTITKPQIDKYAP